MMKKTKDAVAASGLTVLFEPDEPCNAIVDIVFISGPGGHPVKTWQYTSKPATPKSPEIPSRKGSIRDIIRNNSLKRCISNSSIAARNDEELPRQRRVLRKNYPGTSRSESKLLLMNTKEEPGPRRAKSTSRLKLTLQADEEQLPREPAVYWPLDLLPSSCPNTRIITWGCQTLSTKGRLLPAQNNIFDHAEDLLKDLSTLRKDTGTARRAIVLVTHALGGVVVKELLCRSDASCEMLRKDVVQSLAGVVFLGCPHRDSQHGTLRDAVRHLASLSMGVSANDEVLQDLCGIHSGALENAGQHFIRLWNDYNFRAKTFQESPQNRRDVEHNGEQHLLRREATSFGDPRERCEPIDAGPLDLGRFSSADDPAYRSLSFTLLRFVQDEIDRRGDLTPKERAVLRALASQPEKMPQDSTRIESYPGTGVWLYDLPEFRAWHQRSSGGRNRILWIKGHPGSGKSVLLKSLRGRVERKWGPLNSNLVWSLAEGETLNSVFFPGRHRQHHATSPAGVYRSLLSQLYYQDPRLRKALASICRRSSASSVAFEDAQVVTFFVDDYVDQKIETPTRRTFIFVDATDDCGIPYLEDLLYYLSQLAANSDYSICVATTSHAEIVLDNAIEVVMHQQNIDDILRYINLNLIAEWEDRNGTVARIGSKAAGCFLWAEIVVSILNAAIEEGATEDLIEEAIAEMPGDIDGLYEWLFSTLGPEEKMETLILMQWVLFSPEPLRLNDLCIAIQLSQKWHPPSGHPHMASQTALYLGPPASIRDLRRLVSEGGAFDSPSQFCSWVRSRSIGLLELQPQSHKDGIITYEPQGLRRVRFIHESVRNFFLSGRGFACLSPQPHAGDTANCAVEDYADNAHYSLLHACLSYLNVVELESLGRYGRLEPASMPAEESAYWQEHVRDQRQLVMSSYPFLQYTVDNLVFHLLSPRHFRYYLPQRDILRVFSANRCRVWRRWTALLGCNFADSEAVMAKCAGGSAKELLDPVFGTRYRLERIFRKLSKQSMSDHITPPSALTPPQPPVSRLPRPRKRPPVSEKWCVHPQPPPSPLSTKWPASPSESTLFSPLSPASLVTPVSLMSPAAMGPSPSILSPIFVK